MKKFASKLTNEQIKVARKLESTGITTFSQAVKAFERNEEETIEKWIDALEKAQSSKS